jgi:isopenicillin N synthase-like dioxygenase
VPWLEIYTRDGQWIEAPALPGHLLFNNGDMAKVWTNDRFRSAPHRVINKSGKTRYSIPFFVSTRFDVPLSCLPTCQGPGNPPKYAPITYGEYFAKLRAQNFDLPK